jgi:hypothetical protein
MRLPTFQAVGWIKGRVRRAALRVHSQRLSAWNMAHTNTSAHEIDRTVNITKFSTGDPPPAKSAPPPQAPHARPVRDRGMIANFVSNFQESHFQIGSRALISRAAPSGWSWQGYKKRLREICSHAGHGSPYLRTTVSLRRDSESQGVHERSRVRARKGGLRRVTCHSVLS